MQQPLHPDQPRSPQPVASRTPRSGECPSSPDATSAALAEVYRILLAAAKRKKAAPVLPTEAAKETDGDGSAMHLDGGLYHPGGRSQSVFPARLPGAGGK